MDRDQLARIMWDIDQRVIYGHVRTPWDPNRRDAANQNTRKRAEQLLLFCDVRPLPPRIDRAAAGYNHIAQLGGD